MTSGSLVVAPFFTDLSVQRVRYRLQDRLVELTSWKYDMAEAMLSGAMFQEILDMSVDIVPNPIYVTDARYALVASVNTEGEKLPAFRELLDKGFLGKSTLRRLKQEGYISANAAPRAYQARLIASRKKDELPGESYVNHVFRVEGSFYLHVVMLCREKPLSPGLRYVFDVLCESLNHCVMKECYQLGGRTRPENDLVLALVRGEEVDSDILDAYAKSNGVGLQEHFQLIQANNIGKVSMGMLLGMVEEIVPRGLMGQSGGSLYVLANCESCDGSALTTKFVSESLFLSRELNMLISVACRRNLFLRYLITFYRGRKPRHLVRGWLLLRRGHVCAFCMPPLKRVMRSSAFLLSTTRLSTQWNMMPRKQIAI